MFMFWMCFHRRPPQVWRTCCKLATLGHGGEEGSQMQRTYTLQVQLMLMLVLMLSGHCSHLSSEIHDRLLHNSYYHSSNKKFAEITCVSGQKSENNHFEISRFNLASLTQAVWDILWLSYQCAFCFDMRKQRYEDENHNNCDLWLPCDVEQVRNPYVRPSVKEIL